MTEQITRGQQAALDDIAQAARVLLRVAADIGVVLTIEQVPLEPLAMGHYKSTPRVRLVRTEEVG